MQIVIDIPEDVYTRLFDNGIQDNEIAVDDVCEMARAIRNGTPLNEVMAEIEVSMYCDKNTRLVENANASGLKKALEIIGNIGKESEEL